jgi:hypothetical protein
LLGPTVKAELNPIQKSEAIKGNRQCISHFVEWTSRAPKSEFRGGPDVLKSVTKSVTRALQSIKIGQAKSTNMQQARTLQKSAGLAKYIPATTYSPRGIPQVPSALEGLTAVFEMGTGVTPPLKLPERESVHAAHSKQRANIK